MFRDLVLTRMSSNNWRVTSNSVTRKRIITDKLWLLEDPISDSFLHFSRFLKCYFRVSFFSSWAFNNLFSGNAHDNVTHFSKVRKSKLAEYSIKQYCQTRECEMLLPVMLIINLYVFLLLEMISAHVLDCIISQRNLVISI